MKLKISLKLTLIVCIQLAFFWSSVTFAHCPIDFPVDCNNSWCCPSESDCDSANQDEVCVKNPDETSQGCASEEIYGENSLEVEVMRNLRDSLLIKSPEGRELIKLYYQWNPIIIKTLKKDEKFKEELKEIIDEIIAIP